VVSSIHRYQPTRRAHGLTASRGRVEASDNAAMESFFAFLQKNILNRSTRQSREELHLEIVTQIESADHPRRRQRAYAKPTPVEFKIAIG